LSPESPKPPGRLRGLGAYLSASRVRTAGFIGALVLAVGLVGMLTAVEITSRPQFCGSCHIMKPYYSSWKHSAHNTVACVDCHIPPGVTAEIRKKYEALSMVVRYFTGTYGTKPWTEVDDAACLKCHERRLLVGKVNFGDVQFDHTAHLSDMRRGKKLRCTSCHSQIVQGSHIAVTSSTCILCHFKGQEPGTGTARCTLCHQVTDKTFKVGGKDFNHGDVVKFGMDCIACHGRPKGNDGDVARERCIACHNQVGRLEKYGDTVLLHQKHVTEHKVDCMYCHTKIEHAEPVKSETAAARIAAAATGCTSCHVAGHSPQLALYTGTGGRNVKPMPSPMYQAGVRCEGCHIALPGHQTAVNTASEVSCMTCHGARYRTIFRGWKEGAAARSGALRRQLDETARALGARAPAPLADAEANLDLVEKGHAVHNIDYTYALLRQAHVDMNKARQGSGLSALPVPWAEPPYDSPCFVCHTGVENQKGEMFGRAFAHDRHVVGAKLDCAACHRPHEQRAQGEIVRFDAAGCESCHHRKPQQAECITCHAAVRTHKVKSPRGMFDHVMHIDDQEKKCADCHDTAVSPPALKKDACKDCHDD
jgi:nitrate/TMAO reductase-like tetraheme cytochrome c subunit